MQTHTQRILLSPNNPSIGIAYPRGLSSSKKIQEESQKKKIERRKRENFITPYLQKKTRKVKWKISKNIYNTDVYSILIIFMSVIKEFKEFAMKGNVVDLAVGVVIGGAFGKIVTSLVEDIIMPTIGKLT